MRHAARLLPILFASAVVVAHPQAPAVTLETLIDRAGRYVEQYEKAFSAIVCEERQVQRLLRPDGRIDKQRTLTSDFLLIKAGTDQMLAFRDAMSVDGKPVRNREERLRKLFVDNPRTAVAQAQAISKESSRFNVGPSRTPNSPLVPLHVLHPRAARGFRFALTLGGLTFEEFRSPSLVRQKTGGRTRDLLSRGSCIIEAETGRVLGVTLTAGGAGADFSVTLDVRYAEEPALKLLVPVEMREEVWRPAKPRDSRLVVVSSYSNFRRFQVTTEEQIRIPKSF
jgi:hypothetical protein